MLPLELILDALKSLYEVTFSDHPLLSLILLLVQGVFRSFFSTFGKGIAEVLILLIKKSLRIDSH